MGRTIVEIEEGAFALAIVDKTVAGYSDAWQAPGGKTALTAVLADYVGAADFACQITKGQLTASPSTSTKKIDATFCSPGEELPDPGKTSFNLEASFYQDPVVRAGLSSFLYQYDTLEAYFLLGLAGIAPPRAIGRVRINASTFGGTARDPLKADLTLGCSRKPDIAFGIAGSTRLVAGDGTTTDSGAGLTALDGGDARMTAASGVDGGDADDDNSGDQVDGGAGGTTTAKRRRSS